MADRMSAEIMIGGKLRRSWLDEFPVSGLRLDWDEGVLPPLSEADLLAARMPDSGVLRFCDYEAAWGEFQELEGWLREHNMPFHRYSGAKYEYSAELVQFRPDLRGKRNRDVSTLTTPDGDPVVSVAEVEKVVERMAKLAADRKRSADKRLQAWARLFRALTRILPPKLPPLPPFEIADG